MALNTCPEGYVSCPYEKAHKILESRIQTHIVKCRQVHKDDPQAICPYNSTHIFPEMEFNFHVQNCVDKRKIDTFLVSTENSEPLFPVTPMDIPSTEDWNDVEVPTYNPQEYCDNAPVLQPKQGVPPSERKAFRAEERRRMQKYMNTNGTSSFKSPVGNDGKMSITRLPKTTSLISQKGKEQPPMIPESEATIVFVKDKAKPDTQPDVDSPTLPSTSFENEFRFPKYSRNNGRGKKKNQD